VLRRDSSVEKGPPWPAMVSQVTGGQRSGEGTQAGHFAWTGGDDSRALGGFNTRAGEKENEGESPRSCAYGEEEGGGSVPTCRAGAGEQAACVGCARARGSARERKELGRAERIVSILI
jgi:hypothetical protein